MNRKVPNFDIPLIGDRDTLSERTLANYDREKRESNEASNIKKHTQQAVNRLVNQERLQNNTLNTHKNRARNLENEIKALEAQEKAASQARNYTQAANFKNQLEAKKRVLNSTNQIIT